GLLGITD
nr:Chain A, GLY-LEU-LEU-GLY-ILE-THR-ASP [Senecio pinnatifolius]